MTVWNEKMIKRIAIEKGDKAFLPEAYAYRAYFRKNGYTCEFVDSNANEALSFDAIILFHGFHPFWKRYPKIIIGEYHSLSTGKLNRLKDLFKRIINVRADLYIFLNEDVRTNLWFSSRTPYIIREMGYDTVNNINVSTPKVYDIVYAGSPRNGVVEKIKKLADLGFKVAVVGFHLNQIHSNVVSFGRVSPDISIKIISQSKFGLNFTPNIFPYNIQDSTKVIEYCSAGLGVITNKYHWINEFERKRGAQFLDINKIHKRSDVESFNFITPSIIDLSWTSILDRTDILNKLSDLK